MYLFDFPIIKSLSFSYSSFFVAIVLFIKCIVNRNYNREVSVILGAKYNRMIINFLITLSIASIIVTIMNGAFDFTYVSCLAHQIICLEIGMLLIALYKYKKINILNTFINCFFIQSTIQVLSFVSPAFLKVTDIFRTDQLINQRQVSYTGFRGLAISATNFFGLAVAYTILFVVLAFYWNRWNASITKKIIYIFFFLFGAFSAGRTAILGVVVWILCMSRNISRKISKNTILKVGVPLIIGGGVVVAILGKLQTNDTWNNFTTYLLQVFGGNGVKNFSINNSSSLSQLINDYYFRIDPVTFILGDGKYTVDNGSYYMGTDAGYMRNVLYWGIFFTTLLFIYQYKFLIKNVKTKKQRSFIYIIFIVLMILEYKGQTVGFLLISQSCLLLICNGLDELDAIEENMLA